MDLFSILPSLDAPFILRNNKIGAIPLIVIFIIGKEFWGALMADLLAFIPELHGQDIIHKRSWVLVSADSKTLGINDWGKSDHAGRNGCKSSSWEKHCSETQLLGRDQDLGVVVLDSKCLKVDGTRWSWISILVGHLLTFKYLIEGLPARATCQRIPTAQG